MIFNNNKIFTYKGLLYHLSIFFSQLFGHATEDSYPYQSGDTSDTEDCLYDVTDTVPVVGITGYDTMSNDLVGWIVKFVCYTIFL